MMCAQAVVLAQTNVLFPRSVRAINLMSGVLDSMDGSNTTFSYNNGGYGGEWFSSGIHLPA